MSYEFQNGFFFFFSPRDKLLSNGTASNRNRPVFTYTRAYQSDADYVDNGTYLIIIIIIVQYAVSYFKTAIIYTYIGIIPIKLHS